MRSIDLSSRVRQFVYDSKFPVAIVELNLLRLKDPMKISTKFCFVVMGPK